MSVRPAWKAEHVRLTCLFSTRELKDGLWETLVGSPPESSARDRKQGQWQETGETDGLVLSCISALNRTDVVVTLPSLEEPGPQELMALDEALTRVRAFASRIFESGEAPNRLALGAVLSSPTDSRKGGYALLNELLPNVKIDDSMEDFLLQLNRPRPSSAAPNQRINRLSKWSVAMMRQLRFTVAPLGQSTMEDLLPPTFVCRLELDINNSGPGGAMPDPLPALKLVDLWQELENAAKEIAEKGDVK